MDNIQINFGSNIKYCGGLVSFFIGPAYRYWNKFSFIQVVYKFLQELAFHKKHKTLTR